MIFIFFTFLVEKSLKKVKIKSAENRQADSTKWLYRAIFHWNDQIIINPRPILTIPPDSDSNKRYFSINFWRNSGARKSLNFRRLGFVLAILLLPISVYAGAVSNFFSTIFRTADAENNNQYKSVQNMALLTAHDTPLTKDKATEGVIIAENSVLVSEVKPEADHLHDLTHKPGSDQISIYVVREGDTLSEIAQMFDVTVNTVKWGNDLTSNTLRAGQVLIILPISGVKHTVVKGDKVETLAKKYKGDIEEILAYNNLKQGEALEVGSVIIIPDGEVVPHPTKPGSAPRSTSGLKEYAGYYLRPVVGGRKTQGLHGYNGIDIGAPVGTPVLAAADGEVIISRSGGWNGGYGNYVVIRHANGTQTLYSHNSKNNVSVGDTVKQGDVIGFVGATGKATGPHLHFEIRGAKNPF